MKRRTIAGLAVFLGLLPAAQAGWSVGVSFVAPYAPPPPPCRPHCHDYYYYRPRPVYLAPAPVVVQPVQVYQPAPVQWAQPVAPPPVQSLPAPTPVSAARPVVATSRDSDITVYLQQLQNPDHRERIEAATQLGRLQVRQAVDPLLNCLGNDRSPAVREACARALGQIGGSRSLDGLQRAASADTDREVRQSASLAADIVRAQYQR